MNAHSQEFAAMADNDEAELAKAIETRKSFERAIQLMDERIERLKKVIELKAQLLAIEIPGELKPARIRKRNKLKPLELALLAIKIIEEAGRPMTRYELAAAMEAQGVELAGTDPAKNLGTILWRHPDLFEHVEDQGYWPKNIPRDKTRVIGEE